MAPYKVMWRQMISKINTAVTEPNEDDYLGVKTPVTQHVVSFVPFKTWKKHIIFCLHEFFYCQFNFNYMFYRKGFGTPTNGLCKNSKYQPENMLHKEKGSFQEKHIVGQSG